MILWWWGEQGQWDDLSMWGLQWEVLQGVQGREKIYKVPKYNSLVSVLVEMKWNESVEGRANVVTKAWNVPKAAVVLKRNNQAKTLIIFFIVIVVIIDVVVVVVLLPNWVLL